MEVRIRLAAFGVALVAVFGAAFGLGRAVGPVGSTDDPAPEHRDHPSAPAHQDGGS